MASSAKVSDVDRGFKATVDRVAELAKKKTQIRVGILAREGAEPHARKVSGVKPDANAVPTTVLDVAIFNEFGTVTIPPRSFIRAWFDEAEAKIRGDLRVLMRSVAAGKRDRDQVYDLLGQRMVGQVQQRMADGIGPANADSTIAKKGSSTPLIDTGVLRSSVTYDVK